jgi:hypothetical protein
MSPSSVWSAVQLVRLAAVLQTWHSFAGLGSPSTCSSPSITHPSRQLPWKQTLLTQALPQVPQFASSVRRLAVQVQEPLTHTGCSTHAVPQVPQFSSLLGTHAPPQQMSPLPVVAAPQAVLSPR